MRVCAGCANRNEATAYIDPENEAVIQRAVAKLVADKTVIVIAHRLSTITGAAKSGGHVFLLISRGYIPMFCQYNISSLIFQRQMRDEMSDEASGQI